MSTDPGLIQLVLHPVAEKYNQHSLHYRQAKQEPGIPSGQEKNSLLQDNGKSGSNFPSNVLQDDYVDMLLISSPPHQLFFVAHILRFPAGYLFDLLLQVHRSYRYASQRLHNKTKEAPADLFLIQRRQGITQYDPEESVLALRILSHL